MNYFNNNEFLISTDQKISTFLNKIFEDNTAKNPTLGNKSVYESLLYFGKQSDKQKRF